MSALLSKKREDSSQTISGKNFPSVIVESKADDPRSPLRGIATWRFVLAFCVALAADTVGIYFGEIFAVVFDVAVAIVLIAILGFNWIIIPALLVEAVPGLGLFPTWVLAVLAMAGWNTMKNK